MNLTERPPNVLIITSEYPPEMVGGLGTHVFELAKGLGRLGSQVTVLSPSKFKRIIRNDENVTVHFFPNPPSTEPSNADLQWFVDLNKNCMLYARNLLAKENLKVDVIHCHDWLNFPSGYQLGKLNNIPVVGTVHLLQNPIVRWWGDEPVSDIVKQESELCRKSHALITVSSSMKRIIINTHNIPDERIHVVHNGMDFQVFQNTGSTAEERQKLRRSIAADDQKIVIYAGRLTPQKGIPALFEAAGRVLAQRSDVHYVIAGAPDFTQELWDAERITSEARKMFSIFPFWDRVHLLGKVSRERVARLYEVADIAVVPSLYEPFGYAAIEAMSAGLPVVASKIGGLEEIIEHGVNGFLVRVTDRPGDWNLVDADELSAAQLALLGDRELAQRIGRAGQLRALNNFHTDAMATATSRVYSEVLESSAAEAWSIPTATRQTQTATVTR